MAELDRARELADEVMSELIERPAVKEAIRHALTETGLGKKLAHSHPPDHTEP